MSNDAASKPQSPRPKRTFTVTVGLSTVISTILVVCAGFVAMFALGVLLGRGYDPEAGIPELERMMPQPGRPSAPVIISDSDADAAPEPLPRPDDGILGQGDLAYPDSLRTPARTAAPKPREAQPSAQAKPQPKQEQTKPAQQPKQPPAARGTGASGAPGLTPLPMTGTAPVRTAAQEPPKSGDQRVYKYVYQTAAYKDQESSDRFAAKLKSSGLNARTQKSVDNGVTWYRVVVDFTGRPDDTDALRAKLQSLGVGKPIMKSKVAAQ